MANEDIRKYIHNKGIPMWKIAMSLGINDGNFNRKLRVELPQNQKDLIKKIADEIEKENTDMATVMICDFCKKTIRDFSGCKYVHIKDRSVKTQTMSEAKKVDIKLDICPTCYDEIFSKALLESED